MGKLKQETDELINKLVQITALSFTDNVDDDLIEDILMGWGDAAQSLEEKSLEFEADPGNKDALDTIKRTLHTLKGDCGVFGLYKASDIFHEVENLLERYLEEGVCPSEMLLSIVDWLNKILDKIRTGDIHIKQSDPSYEPDNKPEPVKEADKAGIRTLVVDDDFTNRLLLQELLKIYGPVHVAVNGKEAVDAVIAAGKNNTPYDLACLDIMMPEMDGQEALKQIRAHEAESGIMIGKGIKIIMTTALDDSKNIMTSFKGQCDGYITKPIIRTKLIELLQKFSLIKES